MTTPTYAITCPKCGAQLQPVALDTNTAPWLCTPCARGYWASELSQSSRALFRPQNDDWGFGPTRVPIEASIELEIGDAQTRGTSLREDQLAYVDTGVLTSLTKRRGFSPAFLALLETESANRTSAVH